jgi:hypothetical protein
MHINPANQQLCNRKEALNGMVELYSYRSAGDFHCGLNYAQA